VVCGLACIIFKSWFVDYEFPDADGRPYRSSGGEMVYSEEIGKDIPKGWRADKYSGLVDIVTGKGLKRKEYVKDGKFPVLGANGELGRTNNFLFDEDLILTGRVGTLGSVYMVREKAWISDNVLISKTLSVENFYYSYYLMKSWDFKSLNRGSTQPLITQTDLKNKTSLIPNREVLLRFTKTLKPIFDKIFCNDAESKNISQIRDSLLPQLMSGRIRIPSRA